jgi:hypothetical protein
MSTRELEVVSAERQIHRLINTYAERVDAGDFEGVAELFRNGGISAEGVDHVDHGYKAVLDRYVTYTRRFDDDGTTHTKHVTTNVIVDIDLDEGTANARSYFTVFQQSSELPLQPIIVGRYRDSFRLDEGAWQFELRHIIPERYGNLDEHLLISVP